jgi:hypothetical protein
MKSDILYKGQVFMPFVRTVNSSIFKVWQEQTITIISAAQFNDKDALLSHFLETTRARKESKTENWQWQIYSKRKYCG